MMVLYEMMVRCCHLLLLLQEKCCCNVVSKMSSKRAFDAMEAGEWNKVKEIVAILVKEELEEQHGVSYHIII